MQIQQYSFVLDVSEPMKLAFVSDIHEADCAEALSAIRSARPDAVLVGGDFVHTDSKKERGLRFLTELAREYPTFCSVGNHERYLSDTPQKLTEGTGVTLLDDAYCRFRGLVIGGLSSGWSGKSERKIGGRLFAETPAPSTAWLTGYVRETGGKLLLSHHPEYFEPYIRPLPIDLTLSGHAHGGQWRIFGRGVYAPGQGLFPKYTDGLYRERLLVSTGLGNPHSIPRLNNPPKLYLITILPRV